MIFKYPIENQHKVTHTVIEHLPPLLYSFIIILLFYVDFITPHVFAQQRRIGELPLVWMGLAQETMLSAVDVDSSDSREEPKKLILCWRRRWYDGEDTTRGPKVCAPCDGLAQRPPRTALPTTPRLSPHCPSPGVRRLVPTTACPTWSARWRGGTLVCGN